MQLQDDKNLLSFESQVIMLLMSLHLTQGVYIKQLFCTGLCEHWKGYQSGLKKKKTISKWGRFFLKQLETSGIG